MKLVPKIADLAADGVVIERQSSDMAVEQIDESYTAKVNAMMEQALDYLIPELEQSYFDDLRSVGR